MTELVQTEIMDGVIRIRLNREDKKNALTGEMYHGICDAFDKLDSDPALRVGLITGSQDCFTAGNDLVDFMENSTIAGDSPVGRFLRTLPNLKKPLVAAVNGPAVGVGTTLLFHCDLVYAASSTKFSMPFVNLGLCPEAGSSLLLQQSVGYRKACELLMLGGVFDAEKAEQLGLVNEVLDPSNYQDHALAKAKQLAQQPPHSIQVTKQLMRQSNQAFLETIMKAEEEHFSAMLQGAEAKEAFAAFFEKRKPDFSKL